MQELPRARASSDQYLTLLEYMESHGDISRPQPVCQGRARSDQLWRDLASLLNSLGGGVYKEIHKWKKVWSDWKTKTKSKALQIRNHANRTGGGPHSRKRLSDLEERVLAIMGETAVSGQDNVQERGLSQTSSQQAQAQPTRDEFDYDGRTYSFEDMPFNYSTPEDQPGTSSTPMRPLTVEPEPGTSSAPVRPLRSLRGEAEPSTSAAPVRSRLLEPQPGTSSAPVRPLGEELESYTSFGPRAPVQESQTYTPTRPEARVRSQTPAPRSPRRASTQRPRPQPTPPVSVASSPGVRAPRARRRRLTQTPFDRAVTEFVAVEQRRLQLEETREKLLHQRETERLAIERMRVDVFRTVADVGQALLAYLASKDDTVRLSE